MASALGCGVYSFAEAAQLTRLRYGRVREWFLGRGGRASVLQGDYAPADGEYAISFLDLVDVLVAGTLREMGVSLQRVRRVYEKSAEELGRHPFARSGRFFVSEDRARVLRLDRSAGGKRRLYEIERQQWVIEEVVIPFLDRVEYDPKSQLARRWRPWRGVLIDPEVAFGKPVTSAGVATHILARVYRATGEDAQQVADWYGVTTRQVMTAVRFENNLAA